MLRLQENFEIIKYSDAEKLVNKRSPLVSKCCQLKYLLCNQKFKD